MRSIVIKFIENKFYALTGDYKYNFKELGHPMSTKIKKSTNTKTKTLRESKPDTPELVLELLTGKERAVLIPSKSRKNRHESARDHEAFGIWKNRPDVENVAIFVRRIRKGRHE